MSPVAEPELVDHDWLGDDEGHNCEVCKERDDALHLCWPQAHRCFLCEKAPCAWPDIACEPCRRDINKNMVVVTDPVERVLSAHQHVCGLSSPAVEDQTVCACGEVFQGGPGFWRRHVAEKVYEALGYDDPEPAPWVPAPIWDAIEAAALSDGEAAGASNVSNGDEVE